MSAFPIDPLLPELCATLQRHNRVVLSAAPGAGKTTRVPLALLNAGLGKGRIVMLEPRRLAAMRAAQYMASQLGEPVGETVGYRVRGDSKVSARTRIEVVTEGILTRMLQSDPALESVSVLLFDEFHERSLHADLGLALALDAQSGLREDLRIVVMSATLDTEKVAALMDGAPVLVSEGRRYPVQTVWAERPLDLNAWGALENSVWATVKRALREQPQGDVLVFLPGQGEIRRVQALTEADALPDVVVHALFGEAAADQQQAALTPDAQGRRKVILATAIAETSLTIDGVRIVVDAGLSRISRFEARRGMAGLVTVPVSQAAAEQRLGRAGRQAEGACYRLWTANGHQGLARDSTPEILQTDLAPLALELAQWGVRDPAQLRFLDAPPAPLLAQARDLLRHLGALDADHGISAHGRALAALPVHPRYAHMLLQATAIGCGALACDVAALLEERDLLRGQQERDADFHARWRALHSGIGADRAARERVKAQARRYRQMLKIDAPAEDDRALGRVLALAYPDRIGQQRGGSDRYLLSGGVGARLPTDSALIRESWLAVAEIDGVGADARIRLAAALDLADIEDLFAGQIETREEADWDSREQAVIGRRLRVLDALVLDSKPQAPSSEARIAGVLKGLRSLGVRLWPWPEQALTFRQRLSCLAARGLLPQELPAASDEMLLETLEDWLPPFLEGVSRASHFSRIDWLAALESRYSYAERQQIDRLAPSHFPVPTGSRIALDYSGEEPVLAVRIQEMFGETGKPSIAEGRLPLLIHLLSPRGMPLAVTRDLPSFWQNAWSDVRKDMRGQYPKHYWPENPLEAEPTRRSKAADDRAKKAGG